MVWMKILMALNLIIIGQSSSNQIGLALNSVFPNNKQVVKNVGVYFDTI